MLKGGFWTSDTGFEPKAQFRFRVEIDGFEFQDDRRGEGQTADPAPPDGFKDERSDTGYVWYAKSIEKPRLTVVTSDKKQQGQGFPQKTEPKPRSPTFDDIKMTLVDPSYPNATRKLLRIFRRTGYNDKNFAEVFDDDRSQNEFYEAIGQVRIVQLDSKGNPIETWTLINVFIKEVDFGNLDYGSSDLVEINVTFAFETVKCEFPDFGEEKGFTYFNQPFGPYKKNDGSSSKRTDRNLGIHPKKRNLGGA
jgi:hypothetical protein